MATFAQMKTYISARLIDVNNQSVSLASIGDAINDSISYWKTTRFWFNEEFATGTMTLQDGTIPLPNDFLIPVDDLDGFLIEYSDTRYPLAKLSASQYDGTYLSNGFGLPRYYARVGQDYEVYPLPDRAYTVKSHYLKDYPTLVNDSDTNDFTIEASRLINLWTLADLMAELRQDDKMETYYRSAATDQAQNLLMRTTKSNATGTLSNDSFLTA